MSSISTGAAGPATREGARRVDLALLAAVWIAASLLAGPRGDFPLNDDWCYGAAVRGLLEEGVFRPPGWTTITLVSQALWGALFALPFGFSFEALRVSTLVLGLAATLALYLLVLEAGGTRRAAIVGAATLAANPIFFGLAHTFMSDVPFLGFSLPALLLLARSLRTGSRRDLALGAALAASAILCRKLGLYLPIAYAFIALRRRGSSPLPGAFALAPLLAGAGSLLLFEAWLRASGNIPYKYDMQTLALWRTLASGGPALTSAPKRLLSSLIYLGLFLLPPLLWARAPLRGARTGRGRAATAAFLAGGGAGAVLLLHRGARMPLGGNTLDAGGIGPVTLRDVFILHLPHAPALPALFWAAATVAGALGGALLLAHVSGSLARRAGAIRPNDIEGRPAARALLAASALVYSAPLLAGPMFDRYLLPLVPLLAAVLLTAPGPEAAPVGAGRSPAHRVRTASAAAALFLSLAFSVAAAHDYLAWNRVRWEALRDLTERRSISPGRIDGGYEFNGSFTYEDQYRAGRGRSWWWVQDDEFAATMGPLPGYAVHDERTYSRWLPPGRRSVFVLRREAPAEAGRSSAR